MFQEIVFRPRAGAARFVLIFLLFTCAFDTSNLVSGPCSPSLWTILMTPWQLFVVEGLSTWNRTLFLSGLMKRAEETWIGCLVSQTMSIISSLSFLSLFVRL